MKKALVLLILAVLASNASFAQGKNAAGAQKSLAVSSKQIDGALAKAVEKSSPKAKVAKAAVAVDEALLSFRKEVFVLKTTNFRHVLQSMVKVMDAHNTLRAVDAGAAAQASLKINQPFKTGFGSFVTPSQFIVDHACELPGNAQAEFEAWGAQLENDVKNLPLSVVAADVMGALEQTRKYVAGMKEYNAGFVAQSFVSVMDAHNDLRKVNPELAVLLSQEINKPMVTGFGGKVRPSNLVSQASVAVFGDTQDELDSWAYQLDRDCK